MNVCLLPNKSKSFLNTEERVTRVKSTRDSRFIVMACDKTFAMPLATALRSIAEANQKDRCLEVFVLTSQFSARLKRKVLHSLPKRSLSVHWMFVDLTSFETFSPVSYLSKMTYARLLIPHLFPNTDSRVLYLDTDMLVLDDLEPLWNIDLEGAAFGAVIDRDSLAQSKRVGLDAYAKLNPIPHRCDYFNAGLLLIDLARWRREQISERAMQYLVEHPHTPFADQDALNVVSDGEWTQLDPRWNAQAHDARGYSAIPLEQRPAIVHFVGKYKPWNPIRLDVNAQFYDDVRKRTQFVRTPWVRTGEAVQRHWRFVKDLLKQYKVLQAVHAYIKNPNTADRGPTERSSVIDVENVRARRNRHPLGLNW
ncbi:MAG: glycosyl transferase family 8 [Acidobacteriaceae bacterium]|nr:glycosyl transferase family 8 [Acidobacteriaceae bacterium]